MLNPYTKQGCLSDGAKYPDAKMAALIQIQSQCFPILNMQYGNITKYEQDTILDIVHITVLSNLVLILIAEENELRKVH